MRPPLETMREPLLKGQCATHSAKYHMQDVNFLKVTSEVVMCYLLSRHLYVYVEHFDMCGLSFGIGICDMYGKLSTSDLSSLYDRRYAKSY